uniref:Ig-like domain-containing protein n=1 Tax=Lepisosteus oculatus TaxID=7918 RepID=W5M145_LEPOC
MHGRHTFYPFTLPLQVCTLLYVCQVSISGASPLVLNGTLGQSVTLPSGFDEKNYSSSNITLLEWEMNRTVIMQFLNKNWSALKNDHFKDRLFVNTRDGSLTISQLKGGDEGEYVLSGFGSAGNLPQQRITLHVFVEINTVKILPPKSYGADNKTCNLTLTCQVTGGSHVSFLWLKDGRDIPGTPSGAVLEQIAHPGDGEIHYTCTAFNAISNQSASSHIKCNTQEYTEETRTKKEKDILKIIIIAAAAGGGALGMTLLAILICCCMKICQTQKVHNEKFISLCVSNTNNGDVISCYDVVKDRKVNYLNLNKTLYDTVNFNRKKETTQYQEVL